MRIRRRTSWLVAVILGLGLGAAAPVHGQAAELEDGRWLPYLGCWVEEAAAEGQAAAEGPMTCVVPDGDGVAFLTVVDAEITDRRVVRGDDVARSAGVAGCTGMEAARFSADGHRVFTRAELTCSGTERETRGLMAMVEPDRWIDVRALGTPGQSVAWVKRYRPAPATRVTAAGLDPRVAVEPGRAVEAARVGASATIRVDAIIEANARTDAEAVRAWIVEQGAPLRLNADRLLELADAGVPASVIDVAVAVSFPDRFAVAREPRPDIRGDYGYGYGRIGAWDVWSPWGRYGYYGYDRYYGYGYPGYYGTGYSGYGPGVIVVRPVTSSGGGGRVVKGRGYVPGSSAGSRGTATPRSSVRTSPPSNSRGGATSATGSGSSSSKGKAKRRGGGG